MQHIMIVFEKFKKISKRNLPNVGMDGWMEALTDKVHKQGEHIPQHCYISHKHMHPCIVAVLFCYAVPPTHLRLMRHILARAPTNGVQQLSAKSTLDRWSYVAVTLKTKFEMHIPREFSGYWWLF